MSSPFRNRQFTRRSLIGMTAALFASALVPVQSALANSGRRGLSLRKDVAALLRRNSDINGIARFALGRYRKKLPGKMKSQYNKAILNYVAGLFVYYADDFVGSGVKIKASRKNGKFILVDSAVSMSRGGVTPLRWRLRSKGNHKKIADINFKGIWLSLRLRDEIVSVLNKNKGDFGALIAHLHANS